MDEKLKICDKVISHFPAYEVIDPRKIAADIQSTGLSYDNVIYTVRVLCADAYMFPEDSSFDTFLLSSKGREFIRNGGYSGEERIKEANLKSLETETRIRKRNEMVTAISAVLAATGAIGYLVFEVGNHFHWW